MKKYLILTTLISFFNASEVFSQIKILSNGNVGINNNSPSYKFDVNSDVIRFHNWTDVMFNWTGLSGSPVMFPSTNWYLQLGKSNQRVGTIFSTGIHTTSLWYDSDDSIKTNKAAISNPLQTIQQLNGKQYNFTSDYLSYIPDSNGGKGDYSVKQYGFMARELMQVLPELVSYDSVTGRYSVNYISVIPILTEAVKAQQATINRLNQNLNEMQNTISTMNDAITQLQNCCNTQGNGGGGPGMMMMTPTNKNNKLGTKDNNSAVENLSNATLFQNNPNPFNTETEIKYYLPPTAKSATIVIYNLSGQQLMSLPNSNNGLGMQSITIDGGGLSAGSYFYTLLVDGKEIDTKKMILVK